MDELEAQSFKNMVWFFQDELRAIMDGSRGREFFSHSMLDKLRRKNILGYKNVSHPRGGRRINIVTEKAREILNTDKACALLDVALIVLCVLALP